MTTTLQYASIKKQDSKNIKVFAPIYLEVWLFWCDTGILSLDGK